VANRYRRRHFTLPSREDIARHRVSFFGFDVLGDVLRCGKPRGRALLADVVLLLAAQKGAEVHGELIGASIMIRDGLGADFVGDTVDLDSAEDLGGIEKGVEHA